MTDQPGTGLAEAVPFNLTTEPWVGVLHRDGVELELSLRQVFEQAHELRSIVAELPTQEFALLRLLLALAHDALDGPREMEDWAALWEDPECFTPVLSYLDTHRDCLDLCHPTRPFLQSAGLRSAKGEVFSLNRIVADVPAGEPFFSTRMPDVERLTFAEAARWVVHVHAWDTSGIKTGMVGDDRVKGGKVYPLGTGWAGGLGGVFVEGDTLRETLLLNLPSADTEELEFTEGDLPAWRHPPCGPGPHGRTPAGPRELYTWQSRRVLLHHDADGVHGVVLGYGDPLAARNMHRREPMTAWRRSTVQEKKLGRSPVYLPRPHDPSRAAWRGIASLVADRSETGSGEEAAPYLRPGILEWVARLITEGQVSRTFLVRARTVGVSYGTQQSVIDEVVDDRLTMPVVLLHRHDRTCAAQAVAASEDADRAVRALGDLAADVARAAGRAQDGPKETARTAGFDALEEPYRCWLAALAQAADPFAHRVAWQEQAYRIVAGLGSRLIDGAGEQAWEGRTVTTAQSTVLWLSAGLADRWFRGRLAKALPSASRSSSGSDAGVPLPADAGEAPVPGPRGEQGAQLTHSQPPAKAHS
ncbi:type I-E CRISPR-associated protein Cse1/CasA [Streptomyces sp. NPDC048002]|uniref:type I-E CRISPR-associated protein Cse1/CasA n=1 Tax=Streptomyces sp. NPDC048002 TaxID=3154344 RepID=UPI003410659D